MTTSTAWGCGCSAGKTPVRVIDESGAHDVCALHAIALVGAAEINGERLTVFVGRSGEDPS